MDETSDDSSVIDETSKPELIDLTDELFEEDTPRLHISWLADLAEAAKIELAKELAREQAKSAQNTDDDVILIDIDMEENVEPSEKPTDESPAIQVKSKEIRIYLNVTRISTKKFFFSNFVENSVLFFIIFLKGFL